MGYRNIKDPGRANRMGGSKQFILVCAYADFLLLQKPVDGSYKISVAHTHPTGKGFIKLYSTKDTGQLKFATQGGPDRNSFVVDGEFYHPGESDAINEFANLAKNDRFIVLFPMPGSTEYWQVGDDDFQVQIMPEYDTTKNSGDGRGWLFKYSAFAADAIKYVAATVTMATDPA